MSVDVRKVRWTVVDSSIFTEEAYKVKLEFAFVEHQLSVAFNVGKDVAHHIVRLHNNSLEGKQ